jgi:hypothetical protein
VPGAKRQADDHLALALRAAHECEIRDVGARDEKHERRGSHQQPEHERGSLVDGFAQGRQFDAIMSLRVVPLGMIPTHVRRDLLHLGTRLRNVAASASRANTSVMRCVREVTIEALR